MVRIEFTGLPGSGKSTLFPLIKRELLRRELNVYDRRDVIRKYFIHEGVGKLVDLVVPNERIKTILAAKWYRDTRVRYREQVDSIKAYPELFQEALRISNIRDRNSGEKADVITWFLGTLGHQHVATKVLMNNDHLLMDEGFFHKLINLFVVEGESYCDIENIRSYLQLMPKLDFLVKVDVNTKVCVARIKSRGIKRRFDNLEEAGFVRLLHNINTMLEEAISFVELEGTQVIRIKNTGPIEQIDSEVNTTAIELLKPFSLA